MSGTPSRTMTTTKIQVQTCRKPLTPPSFYTSHHPPPHHTSSGFVSPWPSAAKNGFFKFVQTRLFDWDESPLPDANALPAVRPCSWQPQQSSSSTSNDIVFSWLGHAACHFQLPIPASSSSGTSSTRFATILTDPVFSKRCSPFQSLGPQRYTSPPTSVQDMASSDVPHVWPDILVLSHNHYDHLDYNTVKDLLSHPNGKPRPHIFCPLGMASWFQQHLNVPEEGVTELDWWQDRIAVLEGNRKVKLTCVPAQHFSGRSLTDRDQTLWAGWTFEALDDEDEGNEAGKGKRIYFAGDSGYRAVPRGATRQEEAKLATCPAFEEIGSLIGPFDLAAIPIGAYMPRSFMSSVHMAPHDAVCAHQLVKSKKSIGIHWGSFRLTPEDVNEPPKKLAEEAHLAGLSPNEFEVMGIGETRAF